MMKPRRAAVLALVLISLQFTTTGCIGRFALTRNLYKANLSINEKWLRAIATFAMIVVPVYGVTLLIDGGVLNTIEFWGGKNPVDGESIDRQTPTTPTATAPSAARRDSSAGHPTEFALTDEGSTLRVTLSAQGDPARRMMLTMRGENAELRSDDGALIASLGVNDDGSAQVRDATGAVLDEKSAAQRGSLVAALRAGGSPFAQTIELQRGPMLARAR